MVSDLDDVSCRRSFQLFSGSQHTHPIGKVCCEDEDSSICVYQMCNFSWKNICNVYVINLILEELIFLAILNDKFTIYKMKHHFLLLNISN